MIVDQGHGGTILVVPDTGGSWSDSIDPFAFRFATPDITAREWIRQRLKDNQSHGEAFARAWSSTLSQEDKMLLTTALASRQWQPRDAVQHIAPLANCDGAIVMTQDLRVVGFGAKILTRGETPSMLCRFDPIPGPQAVLRCPLGDFGGTRHQSAARFVATNKETVSQDRRMSILSWSDEYNCVFAVEHAEWWA